MGKVVFGMTLSLDGFVQDKNGSVERLYADFNEFRNSESIQDSMRKTGAVVMGRRTFEMGDPDSYVGNYEYQVPIFVLTHEPPTKAPKQDEHLTFTFVSQGIKSAVQQAKVAAGDKDVTVVGGASTGQQLLRAGLIDELEIDIMPVLLGEGLRLFEHIDAEPIELEKISVSEVNSRTQFRFRVIQ